MSSPVTVKIEGLEHVKDRLKGLGPELSKKALNQAVSAGARIIRDAGKQAAPVDTGALRNSIYTKRIKELSSTEEATYFVGARSGYKYKSKNADGWYFHMVEFGTEKMQARPFLRPAFEANKMRAYDKIKERLLKFIEKYQNYTIG